MFFVVRPISPYHSVKVDTGLDLTAAMRVTAQNGITRKINGGMIGLQLGLVGTRTCVTWLVACYMTFPYTDSCIPKKINPPAYVKSSGCISAVTHILPASRLSTRQCYVEGTLYHQHRRSCNWHLPCIQLSAKPTRAQACARLGTDSVVKIVGGVDSKRGPIIVTWK